MCQFGLRDARILVLHFFLDVSMKVFWRRLVFESAD